MVIIIKLIFKYEYPEFFSKKILSLIIFSFIDLQIFFNNLIFMKKRNYFNQENSLIKNIHGFFKKKYIFLIKISFIIFLLFKLFKFKIIKDIYQKFMKKSFNKFTIKICLCTPGKNENRYIREYIEYYLNYGVDKIFLYDNNDLNGEFFEEVISDYINKEIVEIKNWRGIKKAALNIMNNCYQQNNNKYDWLIFYEIDEYIFLKNYNNIKAFLSESKFNKCKLIQLNYVHFTDNNLINYVNTSLIKRFTEKEENARLNNIKSRINVKSIIRGGIPNITIQCIHRLTLKFKGCDGFGRYSKLKNIQTIRPDYKYYYIKHYYSKSLEEFIGKINRGDIHFGLNNKRKFEQISKYFLLNKITLEKIVYIENHTGLNLSIYRDKLNKIKKNYYV